MLGLMVLGMIGVVLFAGTVALLTVLKIFVRLLLLPLLLIKWLIAGVLFMALGPVLAARRPVGGVHRRRVAAGAADAVPAGRRPDLAARPSEPPTGCGLALPHDGGSPLNTASRPTS